MTKAKPKETVIEVVHRGDEWLAFPAGDPRQPVRGGSQAEAVGRLVVAKARRLGIVVRRLLEMPDIPSS